jgi:hypothetical protein
MGTTTVREGSGLTTSIIAAARVFATALLVGVLSGALLLPAAAANIYDSQVMERMTFTSGQRSKVRAVLQQSEREIGAIFRKYSIDPNAKPNFDKLKAASTELQAVEAREKRKMKEILTAEQYKAYFKLLQETAARVIKATRQ